MCQHCVSTQTPSAQIGRSRLKTVESPDANCGATSPKCITCKRPFRRSFSHCKADHISQNEQFNNITLQWLYLLANKNRKNYQKTKKLIRTLQHKCLPLLACMAQRPLEFPPPKCGGGGKLKICIEIIMSSIRLVQTMIWKILNTPWNIM